MCETGFAPEYTFRNLVLSLIRCEPCKCRTGDMQAVLFPDAQSLPFSEPPAAIVHQPISINHSLAIMKNPIKYLPFSFTVLSLFSCAEKTAQKPNVLFISVDDLNDWSVLWADIRKPSPQTWTACSKKESSSRMPMWHNRCRRPRATRC